MTENALLVREDNFRVKLTIDLFYGTNKFCLEIEGKQCLGRYFPDDLM